MRVLNAHAVGAWHSQEPNRPSPDKLSTHYLNHRGWDQTGLDIVPSSFPCDLQEGGMESDLCRGVDLILSLGQ